MTTGQLDMLTQNVSKPVQKQPNNAKPKDDGKANEFKDMLDNKNQAADKTDNKNQINSNDKQDTSVKGQNNVKDQNNDNDVSENQAMLANLLFGQFIMQNQTEMPKEIFNAQGQTLGMDLKAVVNTTNQMQQTVVTDNLQQQMQNVEQPVIKQEVQSENVQNISQNNTVDVKSENAQDDTQGKIDIKDFKQVHEEVKTVNTEKPQDNGKQENNLAKNADKVMASDDLKLQKDDEHELSDVRGGQLFRNIEATPVKVGEAPKVLDTQSPDMEQNLKDILKYSLKQSGDKIEIQLNPSNLGKLTIELTQKDGTLSVLVTAENSKAMNMLSQHAGGLENILKEQFSQPVQVYIEQQNPQHEQSFDGHNGQQRQQKQQRQQPSKDEQQNFVEQLRLGLLQIN